MRLLPVAVVMMARVAAAGPLAVEIKPATLKWQFKQQVEVAVRVVNTTTTPQKFKAWLCSWYENLESDDRELVFSPWACDKNYEKEYTLAPGKAWEQKLVMYAVEHAQPTHTLRLGFTPSGGTQVWSNRVSISVEQ